MMGTRVQRALGTAVVAGLVSASALLPATTAHAETTTPSRVVVLSDITTPVKTWSPYPVHVRLEGQDGTPLAGRRVTVWDDSYMRGRCCGPPPSFVTNANGEISTTLYLDGNSANPVRVAAYWHGDATYDKAIAEWYQPIVGYTTTLDVSAPTEIVSGDPLPISVGVRRSDPDAASSSQGCIDGAVVQVDLVGPTPVSTNVTVDYDPFAGSCVGSVDLPTDLVPGDYTMTLSTGHDGWRRTDEPVTKTRALTIGWQYTYRDASGLGRIYLSVPAHAYRVVLTDGRDSGARLVDGDLTRTGVSGTTGVRTVGGGTVEAWRIDLADGDGGGSAATGTFYGTGPFSASGSFDGAGWRFSS